MSALRIRFAPYVSSSGEAIVPLRILGSDWKQLPGNWELRLDNETLDIPVAPGEFTVQAFMPTGEVISRQATVGADEIANVSLEPAFASPREDLAWGYLLKGASRAAVATHTKSLNLTIRGGPELELWELSFDQRWTKSTLPTPDLRQEVDGVSFGNGRLSTSGKLKWMRVAWETARAKFVALPPASDVRFNLFNDPPDLNDGDPINVVVDAGNPRAESILGYLRRGDFASARQVGASFNAEALLNEKMSDPASAAIGGYFLLQVSDLELLHNWTKNLSEWFEYFPDGAVIHAWHLLKLPQPDFTAASQQLVEAVHRGLPVYTIGLRLLSDGLALMAARVAEGKQEPDINVARALQIVAPYAAAADWTSATTSFYGLQPLQPRGVS